MRAVLLNICSFLLVLAGILLFMDAGTLNSYPETSALRQEGSPYEKPSFLIGKEAGQAQPALLRNLDTEYKVQEEKRPVDGFHGHTSKEKGFPYRVALSFKLNKNQPFPFTGPVPIYLRVLSLRL